MEILKMIFLIVVLGLNGLLLLSMALGCKNITDKTSKVGLSFLRGCLIADIIGIIGGVFLW